MHPVIVVVAQLADVARIIAVIGGEAGTGIVKVGIPVGAESGLFNGLLTQSQARCPRLPHHPGERHVGHPIFRVSAAHIRMRAGEPDLGEALRIQLVRLVALIPQQGVEGPSLIVEGKRVAGALDDRRKLAVGKAPRLDPVINPRLQLLDRQAIGIDGVPQADEADRWRLRVGLGRLGLPAQQPCEEKLNIGLVAGSIFLERMPHVLLQLPFGGAGDQAHAVNEADEHAEGEGATAESEHVDVVAGLVVAAQEGIELAHVLLQAKPDRAPQHRQRLEPFGADAVVIDVDLVALGEIERFADPPDIGFEELGRAVSRPVGQDDDRLVRHGLPSRSPVAMLTLACREHKRHATRALALGHPGSCGQHLLNPLPPQFRRGTGRMAATKRISRGAAAGHGRSSRLRVLSPAAPSPMVLRPACTVPS
jgi:hypothetical protein